MTPDELKAWRARLGWTQAEAARRLGVARSVVLRWETGERTPPAYLQLACAQLEGLHGRMGQEGTTGG